jgi:sulfoxide reductase catalytic subunit YedY
MLIKKPSDFRSSEITPKDVWLRRREFIQASAAALVGAGAAGFLSDASAQGGGLAKLPNVKKSPLSVSDAPTSYEYITSYNNFYEFESGAGDGPKRKSGSFKPRPWKIAIEGEVAKPASYDLDEFIKPYQLEERIYRFRCVETWSAIIPWVGIPLKSVIDKVQPTSRAKFLKFTTMMDPKQFPMQRTNLLEWPYVEGLRIDEASHPLALLVVGLYGEILPNQNGAPIRLIVPWKYGFKGAKSIAKIEFVEKQPVKHLADHGAAGIRFLRQCEPDGRSSALESARRPAARRLPNEADADVQRLSGSGGLVVQRVGSPEELLTFEKDPAAQAAAVPGRARSRPPVGRQGIQNGPDGQPC